MKKLILLTILLLCCTVAGARSNDRVIVVEAGSAESLLSAIAAAGERNAAPSSKRLYILIPNGFYDLGETALTTISGYNVSLVGESMEGTIIRNAPLVANEGISTTATLLNRGINTYVQDLTLKNDLDYYHSGPAGRAVCWQDKGQRAIFKHVRMLSFQDTYYSHSEECQHYFEDSEIHGTVDFLCGAGDVYFNRCLIVTEKRNADGSGVNVIAAPRTSTTLWGYVFNECTIRNDVSMFHYGRGWHTHPRCIWINTRLETPEKLCEDRYDPMGIRSVDNEFFEYHTMDMDGRDITPASHVVEFIYQDQRRRHETIVSADEAMRYSLKNVFPNWKVGKITQKLYKRSMQLKNKYFGQNAVH